MISLRTSLHISLTNRDIEKKQTALKQVLMI